MSRNQSIERPELKSVGHFRKFVASCLSKSTTHFAKENQDCNTQNGDAQGARVEAVREPRVRRAGVARGGDAGVRRAAVGTSAALAAADPPRLRVPGEHASDARGGARRALALASRVRDGSGARDPLAGRRRGALDDPAPRAAPDPHALRVQRECGEQDQGFVTREVCFAGCRSFNVKLYQYRVAKWSA